MKKRILIVDDERWFSNLLAYSLEAEGYFDVRQENDAERAVETARSVGPDLVILDLMMPHIDGSELAERMRHDELLRDVPVLFITNLITESDAPDGSLNRGGQTFMTKTVSIERLLERVEEKLGTVSTRASTSVASSSRGAGVSPAACLC